MFLHHILQQNEASLLHRFFMAQMNHPINKDWVSTVLEDMEDLKIRALIKDALYYRFITTWKNYN